MKDIGRASQFLMDEACDVKVYRVVELIEDANEPKKSNRMDSFILATDVKEAAEIVGENEYRHIIAIEEYCHITRVPKDKYGITLLSYEEPGDGN